MFICTGSGFIFVITFVNVHIVNRVEQIEIPKELFEKNLICPRKTLEIEEYFGTTMKLQIVWQHKNYF